MSEWTPVTTMRVADEVRMLGDGSVALCPEIVARLGADRKVALLTNGDRSKFGIRAFTNSRTEQPYSLGNYSKGRKRVRTDQLLRLLGRVAHGSRSLPYSWDGDVLVIDVSGLPERGLGVRS